MKAKSIKGNSTESIRNALQQCMADGYQPTLAIVFLSIVQDRNVVCEILLKEGIDIFGATSAGEFINGHQSDGEIAILLLDIKKENYTILFSDTKNRDLRSATRIAAETALSTFSNPALILCTTCFTGNGETFDGRALIHSLKDELGDDVDIFGGMAGADGALIASYVFSGDQSTDEGHAILVLDKNKISLCGTAISGWKPLGRTRTVTKCEDGWMYEIDGQPALEMYLRYLGQSMKSGKDSNKIIFVEDIGFFYPFLAIGDGEPSLRTPMEVDKEKNAIKLDFSIAEGNQLQFTVPPDFDIIETVLDKATALKKETNATADALLIFSCLGRRRVLGPLMQEENDGLHKIWNVPMAGFYSYGEYGTDADSENIFHSATCSWVAIKEK